PTGGERRLHAFYAALALRSSSPLNPSCALSPLPHNPFPPLPVTFLSPSLLQSDPLVACAGHTLHATLALRPSLPRHQPAAPLRVRHARGQSACSVRPHPVRLPACPLSQQRHH
ncbi:unnamed protein product, partial [Closterium sp. NIES-54]